MERVIGAPKKGIGDATSKKYTNTDQKKIMSRRRHNKFNQIRSNLNQK